MGGTGSGRTRKNQSPSSFLKIDVRRLQREGALGQGAPFMWQWTLNGRSTGHAYAANKGASLSIDYGFRTTGGVWKQSNFVLSLVQTPLHYGGSRPWFLCPQSNCGRRVAILYGDTEFACRKCRKLSYPTQRVAPASRALARTQSLRVRLGGSADLSQPFPAKPKGMHSWRYTKLGLRALRAEAQYDADICRWVDSIRRHRTNQPDANVEH